MRMIIYWIGYVLLPISAVCGYYGRNPKYPKSFRKGQQVKLNIDQMTSTRTFIPMDYYKLPFCQPSEGVFKVGEMEDTGLGHGILFNSPFDIRFQQDLMCQHLCITNLGRHEHEGLEPSKVVKAIRKDYHNNWYIDNLPSASKTENDVYVVTRYTLGFPIGYVDESSGKSFIYNHFNLEIQYNQPDKQSPNQYNIVRFTVEPFSILHDFAPLSEDEMKNQTNNAYNRNEFAKIKNPIESCDPNQRQVLHTTYDMIHKVGQAENEEQVAAGKVLFTYDVIWTEDPDLPWSQRWDIYLEMARKQPGIGAQGRGGSSLRKWTSLLILAAMCAAVYIQQMKRRERSFATNRSSTDGVAGYSDEQQQSVQDALEMAEREDTGG